MALCLLSFLKRSLDRLLNTKALAENANHEYSCEEEAMPIPYLPQQVFVEILSKLSVKSLLKFKCVSKSWRSLISDSHFIKTHLNQNQTRRILIAKSNYQCSLYTASFGSASNDIVVEKIDFVVQNNPHPQCQIIGSCNGLICLEVDFQFIYVFNPSTRESKPIPDCNFLCNVGFGYDRCSDDYKLVKITSNSISVYSLRMGCWRKVLDFPKYTVNVLDFGIQLNGDIHWFCLKDYRDEPLEIAAFSLVDEKLWRIPLPTSFTGYDDVSPQLGVFEGCLCILPCRDDKFWVMKEYGVKQSWTKFDIKNPFPDSLQVLALLNYDEDLLLLAHWSKLVLYNKRAGTYRNLVIPNMEECDLDFHHAMIYVDSLVSPRQTNEI
ncbi:F-box/kelch-repeat protein At3g06240-like [Cornus florida]|uniref:F-box/kelch-repeat protein At3g06240-like n=1 Tax=Cornus florida TaxID=4283 RepID=UPI0028986C06|nr:F-box/kelch-repeat protein At3g06240-like [Cornus florida]